MNLQALARQVLTYGIAGGMALLVDWASFVALTSVDFSTSLANLLARLSGAGIAYWLNGAVTFKDAEGSRLGWCRFGRFAIVWAVLTVVSTLAIRTIELGAGLHWAWLAKPLVEVALASISFLAYRAWIYK
jgi:putative flippase GtrA